MYQSSYNDSLQPAAHESYRLSNELVSSADPHRVRADFTEFYFSCSLTTSHVSNVFNVREKVARTR